MFFKGSIETIWFFITKFTCDVIDLSRSRDNKMMAFFHAFPQHIGMQVDAKKFFEVPA